MPLDCLPCVPRTLLAWLSLASPAELTAQLVLLELLPRWDEDLQRCPTAAPCSSLPPFPLLPGRNVLAAMLCLLHPWGLAGMFGITLGALSHLCARLVSVEESILKVREENSVKYQRTFLGSEMIDWLVQEGEVENRQEAVELGRALLEHGIIQHGEPGMSVAVRGTNPHSSRATSAGQVPTWRWQWSLLVLCLELVTFETGAIFYHPQRL